MMYSWSLIYDTFYYTCSGGNSVFKWIGGKELKKGFDREG